MIQLFLLFIALPTFALSSEVWGYLMQGEERFFPVKTSITDIAHFSATVQADGTLKNPLQTPPQLPHANEIIRHHLVITAPWNSDLYHHYFDPDLPFRDRIIQQIVQHTKPYDGVQIDFEGISSRDGTAFLNFLIQLKKNLPEDKLFSVAVMARWAAHKQNHPRDPYDYPIIGRIADRVIIMAYDEHYRTGTPGPIASLDWCKPIYEYALHTIPAHKLIMGIPLYGRAWQPETLAKAYKNRELQKELRTRSITPLIDLEIGGHFSFTETVSIEVYHETLESIRAKQQLYLSHPIGGTAYWRIGQEPAQFYFKN
ncbi:MAG: glycosyl hydrolase family 18 protein [Pontiellaceae bacterium]